MITHAEAQALLSERLDAPLDPYVNDILEAHLASCDECRAFATSSAYLATSLRALPLVPASASVRQNVWAAIEQQQHSWWRRFLAAMTGQTAAVVSTAAVALIVIAFASVAIMRLVDTNDGNDDPETRLAAGTQESIALATESAESDETEVTATEVATEGQAEPTGESPTLAPTEPSEVTTSEATTESLDETVAPTAAQPTEAPTEEPVGTEPPVEAIQPTEPPVETNVPTETTAPTTPPTSQGFSPTAASDEAPTDLTGRSATSPAAESNLAADSLSVFDPASLLATAEANLPTAAPSATTAPATETLSPSPTDVPPTETPAPPTATQTPTATAIPPTETPVPSPTPVPPTETPVPTSTLEPPTETPVPATATATPTATEETSTSPLIEPVEGSTAIDANPALATATPAEPDTDTGDGSGGQITDISGTDASTSDANDEATSTEGSAVGDPGNENGSESPLIGPADKPDPDQGQIESTTDTDSDADTTTDATTEGDATSVDDAQDDASGDFTLSEAPFYSDGSLWGSPDARLGYDDGVIFSANPDGYGLGRDEVDVQTVADENGQSIAICANGDCTDATSESANGPHTDEPIGWVDGRLIYQRIGNGNGQPVEIRAVEWNGEPVSDNALGSIDNPVTPLGAAYPVDAGTLVPTSSAWLLISGGNATVVDQNPYGEIRLVRTNFGDDLITYVAEGQLIIASTSSPGSAISAMPFNGVDYDLSERNQAVVISTGSGLEIRDLGGSLIAASDSSIATGSVLWLREGIVFIDQTNSSIRLLDPAVLDPSLVSRIDLR